MNGGRRPLRRAESGVLPHTLHHLAIWSGIVHIVTHMIVWFGLVATTRPPATSPPTTRAPSWEVISVDPLLPRAQNTVTGSWLETNVAASGQWPIVMTEAAAATPRDGVGPFSLVLRTYLRDLPSLRATEAVGIVADSLPPLVGHQAAQGRCANTCPPCKHVLAVRSARVRRDTTDPRVSQHPIVP